MIKLGSIVMIKKEGFDSLTPEGVRNFKASEQKYLIGQVVNTYELGYAVKIFNGKAWGFACNSHGAGLNTISERDLKVIAFDEDFEDDEDDDFEDDDFNDYFDFDDDEDDEDDDEDDDEKEYFTIKVKDSITERPWYWNIRGEMDFLLNHKPVEAFISDGLYAVKSQAGASQEYYYLGEDDIDIL